MSVDRRTFFGLFIILTSFAIGTAHGGPVTVTGISGVFSNPVLTGDVIEPYGPPTFFDNTATAESAYEAGGAVIRWGNITPTPGYGTSALGFIGAVPPASPVAQGEEFLLGTVLFSNGTSELDTLIFGADLTLSIASSAGGPVDDLLLNVGIDTTRNGYGADFDADFVTISGLPSPTSLHAYEGALVQANLFGMIVGDPMIELTRLELVPGQASNGFIGNGTAPAAVPEIDAGSGTAVVAWLGVMLALTRERRRGR